MPLYRLRPLSRLYGAQAADVRPPSPVREVDRTSVTRRVGTTQAVNKAHLTQAAEAMRSPAQRQVIQPEMSMRMAAKTPQRPKRGAEECREAQRAEHEDLGRALHQGSLVGSRRTKCTCSSGHKQQVRAGP